MLLPVEHEGRIAGVVDRDQRTVQRGGLGRLELDLDQIAADDPQARIAQRLGQPFGDVAGQQARARAPQMAAQRGEIGDLGKHVETPRRQRAGDAGGVPSRPGPPARQRNRCAVS